ncbi:hypothetical protein C4D60_Mb01t18520 [Musa balbisiana]|uniref:Uncharacterized protein n=1 Tax=Musa balbisiana TaxID=52838 RepID=A0A4S8JQ38_MUSBA|nr:hypothetical protein C4D60_Mb01t18520 [Musa balbisiana]
MAEVNSATPSPPLRTISLQRIPHLRSPIKSRDFFIEFYIADRIETKMSPRNLPDGLFQNSSAIWGGCGTEKGFMEMEGRGYSDLLRNSSEEMILKSLMENPIGSSAPTMEMPGFRNTPQTFRGDNSWFQLSKWCPLMSTEISGFANQQNETVQRQNTEDKSFNVLDDQSSDVECSIRRTAEKSMQASNLLLAKAWFHSSQPMTRSRSSELRRRYAAMQNSQIQAIAEAQNNIVVAGVEKGRQQLTSDLCDISMGETASQLQTFMSPSNSATSPFDAPLATVDMVSSVVNMLKDALETKKLGRQVDGETLEGSSYGLLNVQPEGNIICNQDATDQVLWPPNTFDFVSSIHEQNSRNSKFEKSLELNMDGFVTPANQFRTATISQEPSQSGSSTAVPTLSTGFEVCDDLSNSTQTISVCESSKKHTGNGNLNHKTRENREKMLQSNFKDDRKKGNPVLMGSVSSGVLEDKGDSTKKRRVERSRKMAEAKERNLAPTLPSDMQSVLKRCDTLEKEVRSLKLNLSFMNRKDSEQTKQIEELQKENEDLKDEKRRLVEEIERIYPESGSW